MIFLNNYKVSLIVNIVFIYLFLLYSPCFNFDPSLAIRAISCSYSQEFILFLEALSHSKDEVIMDFMRL